MVTLVQWHVQNHNHSLHVIIKCFLSVPSGKVAESVEDPLPEISGSASLWGS